MANAFAQKHLRSIILNVSMSGIRMLPNALTIEVSLAQSVNSAALRAFPEK